MSPRGLFRGCQDPLPRSLASTSVEFAFGVAVVRAPRREGAGSVYGRLLN